MIARVPEPFEAADDAGLIAALAASDLSAPARTFQALLAAAFPGDPPAGRAVDLGCGLGDVALRLAAAHPGLEVDAVDASAAMLEAARSRLGDAAGGRVRLHRARLPGDPLPRPRYDWILSSFLLHHLPDPAALWDTVRRHAGPGTRVLVVDLLRPADPAAAGAIVQAAGGSLPPRIADDFRASLHAAYTVAEVRDQLGAAGLGSLAAGDVHGFQLVVQGRLPGSG